MPIHKLANGPITLSPVTAVESAEGQFGPQMIFKGNADDIVYISELSGAKGLARLNLTAQTAIGETLTLEQIKKDGKTFTNITLAGAGAVATPTAAASAAPTRVAAPAMSFEEITALYVRCVDVAFSVFGARCEEAGVAPDAASLQAAAATLFIKATK